MFDHAIYVVYNDCKWGKVVKFKIMLTPATPLSWMGLQESKIQKINVYWSILT